MDTLFTGFAGVTVTTLLGTVTGCPEEALEAVVATVVPICVKLLTGATVTFFINCELEFGTVQILTV